MRILILGGTGMLGHRLWLSMRDRHDVFVTSREAYRDYERYRTFDEARFIGGVSGSDHRCLQSALEKAKPEAVVNCIGIVKQRDEAQDPIQSIEINALLPHRLASLCKDAGARLVHISTDCVFNGHRGDYRESDPPNAEDLYGRSKALGELDETEGLTLRTSIIGRETKTQSGLVEWFLSQRGKTVNGYRNAIYTGLTTHELARVIERILTRHPEASGVWHVSGDKIDKHRLLQLANEAFKAKAQIEPADEPRIDRSLDSSRFRAETGYSPPDWRAMIEEMAADPTPYDAWRQTLVA